MSVHAVILRKVGGFYEIYYRHEDGETLVDRSDNDIGHDREVWLRAAGAFFFVEIIFVPHRSA